MKSLSSWLLVMFMAIFWIFRVIVAFQAQYQKDFGGFVAFNLTVEIVLLFITILCIILILRRMLLRRNNIFTYIRLLFRRIHSNKCPSITNLRRNTTYNCYAKWSSFSTCTCSSYFSMF